MEPARIEFTDGDGAPNEAVAPCAAIGSGFNLSRQPSCLEVARLNLKFFVGLVPVLLGLASAAHACHPRTDPLLMLAVPSGHSEYDRIFVGTVVGVRLDQVIIERERAKKSGREMIEVDGSLPFSFEVYPEEVLKGDVEIPQRATSGGCIVVEPNVFDRVVVFMHTDGTAMFRYLQGGNRVVSDDYVARVRRCLSGSCDAETSQ